jgi:carboxypeptidase Taq
VKPGLIRVDADEVTYPAHIILRYEIERPLIEGEIEPEDVPALWDAKMMELLGLDTRGNFKDGPLQDVHWPEALFGYFPCYSLGAMYAAQWFAAMRRAMPDLDARIGARRLSAGLRLAARQHLDAGQPLDHRRTGACAPAARC